MYDVVVIGAGIIGTSIARELSRFELDIALVERANDVAVGQTKGNSAIVHAGYDAHHTSVMGKMNAKGNPMFDKVCDELDVPLKRNGSLVLAFANEELATVKELYDNGQALKIPGLEILTAEQIRKIEPNITDMVVGGLYAKTAGICGTWEMAIAYAENAIDNGVELKLNHLVQDITKREDGSFLVKTSAGDLEAQYVINCAGLYSDAINNMVAEPFFKINPRRGQYMLLDKTAGGIINTVVFQCPSELGKGVLVSPTVHGNIFVGPDSEGIPEKEDNRTTGNRLQYIKETAARSIKDIPFNKVITTFAGVRAEPSTKDFIIGESDDAKGFVNVAGIKSPGLTSAPAIAEEVVSIVDNMSSGLKEKKDFNPRRRPQVHFNDLSETEKASLIKKDPRFGRIICRCEYVTEGEIVDIIHRNAGARTVDGVKRRARPGTGRCQGGFCGPRVMEILARELNQDIESIVKDDTGSYLLTGRTKAL
jgi:glycerol-3-phosphate dehydrogenase